MGDFRSRGSLKGPVMQGSPEQDQDQDPRLVGYILLVEVLGDDADSVVQRRPQFAFHDCSRRLWLFPR